MANRIAINTSTLQTDSESVQSSIRNMTKSLDNMNTLKSNLDSMWDGQASEKFKTEWGNDLVDLKELIQEISDALYQYETNAKTKYDACENKVQSIVSSINI